MHFAPATPELSVPDVAAAQAYYRDHLRFKIGWHNTAGRIGAVSRGDCALFLRQADAVKTGGTFWVFVDDVDAAFADLKGCGATITEPVADTPWGLRQFTVADPYGNTFYLFHDL
ncbi:VOC family protein [Yoonia sp. R2331]|uniref:VOC family protein n=1 Tax=Yoonia sp. R2331 TaxID=3237238 RepID=UPI0034E55CCD